MQDDNPGRVIARETRQEWGVRFTRTYWADGVEHRDIEVAGPWSRTYATNRARSLNKADPECKAVRVSRFVSTVTRDWMAI